MTSGGEKKMFLHLGKNVIIHLEDVIAILDVQSSTDSKYTSEFIKIAEDEGFVKVIEQGKPKSIVITENTANRSRKSGTESSTIYFSPISSATLNKRAGLMYNTSV